MCGKRWAIDRTRLDPPAIVVHRLRRGPSIAIPPGHVDVAHFVSASIAIRHDRSIGCDRDRGRTALAHPIVDERLRNLTSAGVETGGAHSHAAAVVAVVSLWLHGAAVEPHQAEPGGGRLEQ